MKIRSRKQKLINRLSNETNAEDVDKILRIVEDYEKNNLNTINKLERRKKIYLKKINGGLRQTISSHGPITMQLIGSATKRIYGGLLEAEREVKYKFSKISYILGIITGIIGLFLLSLCNII